MDHGHAHEGRSTHSNGGGGATSKVSTSSAGLHAQLEDIATPVYPFMRPMPPSRAAESQSTAVNGSSGRAAASSSGERRTDDRRSQSRWDNTSSKAPSAAPTGPSSNKFKAIPTGPRSTTLPPPPANYFLPSSVPAKPGSLEFVPRKKARLSSNTPAASTTTTTHDHDKNERYSAPSGSTRTSDPLIPVASTSTLSSRSKVDGEVASSSKDKERDRDAGKSGPTRTSSSTQLPSADQRPPPGPLKLSSSTSPNRSSRPIASPSSIPPSRPNYWKPPGAKDQLVTYEPALDPSPVKKGKDIVYRYDGEGVREAPSDPRRGSDQRILSRLKEAQHKATRQLKTLAYTWDRNSTGDPPPPPPSAILVTNFPSATTYDELQRHFTSYGRIASLDSKVDSRTGGSLGICWISFKDDAPRDPDPSKETKAKWETEKRAGKAQDGNAVALLAIAKANGTRVGTRMMMAEVGIKVVMDGDGKATKAAVAAEMERRAPKAKPTPKPPPPAPAPTALAVPLPPEPAPKLPTALPPGLPPRPPSGPILTASPSPYHTHQQSSPFQSSLPPPSISLPAKPGNGDKLPNGSRLIRTGPLIPPPPVGPVRHASPHGKVGPGGHEPYQPIVFSGTPSIFNNNSTSSRAPYRANSAMASAVQAAVLQAKKRLEVKQKKESMRSGEGELDMELDSEEEAAAKASSGEEEDEEEDEEPIRDRVHMPSMRRGPDGRAILQPGQAPAAAVAWQASPQVLREKLRSNAQPYLTIHRGPYTEARTSNGKPVAPVNGMELEAHFVGFPLDRTFADKDGWYITFTTPDGAQQALDKLQGRRYAGAPLELIYCESLAPTPPPRVANIALQKIALAGPRGAVKPLQKTSGWTDAELLSEAADTIVADLITAFRSDVSTRLITPKIHEELDIWERAGSQSTVVPSPVKLGPGSNHVAEGETAPITDIKQLSFARRNQSAGTRRKPVVSNKRRLSSEAPSESPDLESRHQSPIPRSKPLEFKKKTARIDEESASEEDTPPVERKRFVLTKKTKKDKSSTAKPSHLDYTSSEDDGDDSEAAGGVLPASEVDQPEPPLVQAKPAKKKAAPRKKKVKETDLPVVIIPESVVQEDVIMLEDIAGIPTPAPTDTTASTTKQALSLGGSDHESDLPKPTKPKKQVKANVRALSPDPYNRGIAADEEDLFYLKQAIERIRAGNPLHPTPPPSDDEADPPPRHQTGAARTEGFYTISVAEKLANRPKNVVTKTSSEKAGASASGVAVSRLARANTRGLVRGMELHKKVTATDTDVLKFNQLRTRKKQLTFKRSGIEGYGLFAKEHIPAGEMVIEYVGELIRQQVADRREKAYERQGIGSSYLFRVDEDLVVDATKKGNLGRLINHCCAPNCTARIITISGEKKIVIYAKTSIEPGDEVTYDYHFPHEEVKIPCLCGHPLCRKWLN